MFQTRLVRFPTWDVFEDFGEFFGTPIKTRAERKDDSVILRYSVPGFGRKDIKVTVNGDTLTVSGKSKSEFVGKSDFSYSYMLSDSHDADNVTSSLENGILSVVVPSKKVESKKTNEKIIEIK